MSLVANRAQFMLPFAEKEWIDVARAARILGIGVTTLYRLRECRNEQGRPFIEGIDCGHGRRQRVKYSSVVAYCDYLRQRYSIPDRRPPLDHPIFRHRDEDLLPFPLVDTMGIQHALRYTPWSAEDALYHLIEEGAFWAYRILPSAPWRISRNDFARWLDERHTGRVIL